MKPCSADTGSLPAQAAPGALLERVLGHAGWAARRLGDTVLLPSGLRLEAALLESHALEDGGVFVGLRIVAFHDTCFPAGLAEFQHATGPDVEQAMAAACAAWVPDVLVTLEDAVRPAVRECDLMRLDFPAPGTAQAWACQALLGPVARVAPHGADADELCPYCMLTRLQDALRDCLPRDRYSGIRLVAARDAEGRVGAECRINGERFPAGVERLLAYARAWPGRGLETRSQYVVIRPRPDAAAISSHA